MFSDDLREFIHKQDLLFEERHFDPDSVNDSIYLSFENLVTLPTGSIMVNRHTGGVVFYHSNDVNVHAAILVWACYQDGCCGGRIHKMYEQGKKLRPLMFEVTVTTEGDMRMVLNVIDIWIREREVAYRPRAEVHSHPRFLDTVTKIIEAMTVSHNCNQFKQSARHKYQPLLFSAPVKAGYYDVKSYIRELMNSGNPLGMGMRTVRHVASSCIDAVVVFLSILHEDLFMNTTPLDLELGVKQDSKPLFPNDDPLLLSRMDTARLLQKDSPFYRYYENHPVEVIAARKCEWEINLRYRVIGLAAFILTAIAGVFIYSTLHIVARKVFARNLTSSSSGFVS